MLEEGMDGVGEGRTQLRLLRRHWNGSNLVLWTRSIVLYEKWGCNLGDVELLMPLYLALESVNEKSSEEQEGGRI